MKVRRYASAGAAAVLALTLVGCSDDDGDADDTETTSAGSSAADPSNSGAAGGEGKDLDLTDHEFPITPEKALEISKEETGDGTVHAIELDWSDTYNTWAWTVKTRVSNTDNEVEINAEDGTVLQTETDDTDDAEEPIDLSSPLTKDEAQEIALGEVAGPIRSWKLEWDDEGTEYQFDIGDPGSTQEVNVNVDSKDVHVDQ